jgi:hypothetical protein
MSGDAVALGEVEDAGGAEVDDIEVLIAVDVEAAVGDSEIADALVEALLARVLPPHPANPASKTVAKAPEAIQTTRLLMPSMVRRTRLPYVGPKARRAAWRNTIGRNCMDVELKQPSVTAL